MSAKHFLISRLAVIEVPVTGCRTWFYLTCNQFLLAIFFGYRLKSTIRSRRWETRPVNPWASPTWECIYYHHQNHLPLEAAFLGKFDTGYGVQEGYRKSFFILGSICAWPLKKEKEKWDDNGHKKWKYCIELTSIRKERLGPRPLEHELFAVDKGFWPVNAIMEWKHTDQRVMFHKEVNGTSVKKLAKVKNSACLDHRVLSRHILFKG